MLKLKNLRTLLTGAVVLGIAVAVFLGSSELSRIAEVIKQAEPLWLMLAILPQAGTYYTDALTYLQTMAMLRIKAKLADAFNIALSMEFLNDVTPSFGAASNLYLAATLKNRGFNDGQVGLTLMVQSITSFAAFSIALLAAAVYLLTRGELSTVTAVVSFIFIGAGAIFWTFIFLIFISEKLMLKLMVIAKLAGERFLRKRFAQQSFVRFVSEVRNGKTAMGQNKRYFLMIVTAKISRFFFEGLTIFILFRAFNLDVSYEIASLGFLAAMLLSTFSFLPGGIGSFEALMVLTYRSYGVPLETAGVVTLAYRVHTFWLPMPIGMLAFQRTMSSKADSARDLSAT